MQPRPRIQFVVVVILVLATASLFAQQRAATARASRGANAQASQATRPRPVQSMEVRMGYPKRAPAPPALVAHGKELFESNCSFCHGSDARGGETGPNLVRAKVVLDDQHGEILTPIVQDGFPSQGMPKFKLTAADITAIAAFLHSLPLGNADAPTRLDILVGNAQAGKAYFNGPGHCTTCHSVTGDLAGIGAKYDPKTLQNIIVSGRPTGRGIGRGPAPKVKPTTATVTLPSGQKIEGKVDQLSPFIISLTEADGTYRTFRRDGSVPKVVIHDPIQWHIDMLPKWKNSDIHNLTAYLVTLK